MPLTTQIANFLYDGAYTIAADSEAQVDVGVEVDAVRAIAVNGYVNLVWSARFVLGTLNPARAWYDSRSSRAVPALGWYEIRYGLTPLQKFPLDDLRVATPKVTGVYDGATLNAPGSTYVVGGGATIQAVNIASDRPYRGDTLRWYVEPGVSGTLFLAVTTGFIDNAGNTNRYIIHP